MIWPAGYYRIAKNQLPTHIAIISTIINYPRSFCRQLIARVCILYGRIQMTVIAPYKSKSFEHYCRWMRMREYKLTKHLKALEGKMYWYGLSNSTSKS